jgi:hypothetical protein
MNEMKLMLKYGKSKMLPGLKVHQDGLKSINILEWRSVVAFMSDGTPFGLNVWVIRC